MDVVVETAAFIAAAKAARLTADKIDRIVDHIARRPDAGDMIQGTGGARKVRSAVAARARAAAIG